ncbi:MAG: hypothetical protein JWQ09_3439 [Segetibacter sp.]|nr:hypothetical protein [Segetibacter sp.]
MLSGSVAMSIYILPRATRDFDFIIHLQDKDIYALADHFKEGYYCEVDSIKEAVKNKSMFNIIDHASGFKADFVILKDEPYRKTEFARRVEGSFLGLPIYIVTAEDLLISKLLWIQQIQSNIQMEDIKNLKELENLDWPYINTWIKNLKINTFGLI